MLQATGSQLRRSLFLTKTFTPVARGISVSTPRAVKDVIEHRDGKTLTIEAVVKDSSRVHRIYQPNDRKGACPLCALGLDVKHTDVLILEQFLKPNGGILPKRITGLCSMQQRKLSFLIAMALQAGLFPTHGIASARLSTRWIGHHKRFNSYFDENTITPAKHYLRVKRAAEIQAAGELALAELGEK